MDGARLWRTDGTLLAVLRDPHGTVTSAAFTRDGRYVWTGSSQGAVRRWIVNTSKLVQLAKLRLEM